MKNFFLLFGLILFACYVLDSCSKGAITGCTDPNATNYYSSATKDDGSCTYTGNVIFWTSSLSIHNGTITVTLDDGQNTTITTNNTSSPLCGTSGGGGITGVPKGTHTYSTKDGLGKTSSGSFTISTNGCWQQNLN